MTARFCSQADEAGFSEESEDLTLPDRFSQTEETTPAPAADTPTLVFIHHFVNSFLVIIRFWMTFPLHMCSRLGNAVKEAEK